MMKKILVIIIAILLNTQILGQWSVFDNFFVNKKNVKRSLSEVKKILQKDEIDVKDIKSIYFLEIQIGKHLEGSSFESPKAIQFYKDHYGKYGFDSTSIECAEFMVKHIAHFRKLIAGWKEERIFYEPGKYWIDLINKIDSNSTEAREIMFDQEFKDLVRQFSIDLSDRPNNTCEGYTQSVLDALNTATQHGYSEEELKDYKKELIDTILICNEKRKDFLYKKNNLLEKYKHSPFTKILQNISENQIYVYVYRSQC